MSSSLIKILAHSIHISNKMNNNILKTLLLKYAKDNLSNKQYIFLHIKLTCINEYSDLHILLCKWITNHDKKIVRQLLYYET